MASTDSSQESRKPETAWPRALSYLQEVFRKKPDPFMYFLQIIIDSKSEEVINIFLGAFPEERSRVVQIMTEIDPANKSKYEKITAASPI